jgi:hypothetical protein
MNEHQSLAIKAISQMMGDDSVRAHIAFRGMDLQQPHGDSGKTRAQVLADYAAHDNQCEKAILWVRSAK